MTADTAASTPHARCRMTGSAAGLSARRDHVRQPIVSPMTADMADNDFSRADPFNADLSKAIPVSRTPYTPKFFELINSPQGPWLQMLQRVYYTNDDLDTVLSDAKQQMKDIACQ